MDHNNITKQQVGNIEADAQYSMIVYVGNPLTRIGTNSLVADDAQPAMPWLWLLRSLPTFRGYH